MQHFLNTLFALLNRDEEGATAVEYGLLVGLIAVAIIGAVVALGGGLDGLFDEIAARLNAINIA